MTRAALAMLLLLALPASAGNNPMTTSLITGLKPGVYAVWVGSGYPRLTWVNGVYRLRTPAPVPPATVRVRFQRVF
jgi:hypothetical protein